MESYSQDITQQDRWVVEILNGKKNGYFVDIGASSGIDGSNTYILEKNYDWEGICVEANTTYFEWLSKKRKSICENICVYDREGELLFVEPNTNRGYGGILSHLSNDKKTHWGDGKKVKKSCTTLENLLRKHKAPKVIDYLSMDIEGAEHAVLCKFPFDKYQFRTITIEDGYCTKLLESHGYEEVKNPYATVDWEHFYIKRELI